MNVKKEVVTNLQQYFQRELSAIDMEIGRNRRAINSMTERQEVLKRSRAKLDMLSRELD